MLIYNIIIQFSKAKVNQTPEKFTVFSNIYHYSVRCRSSALKMPEDIIYSAVDIVFGPRSADRQYCKTACQCPGSRTGDHVAREMEAGQYPACRMYSADRKEQGGRIRAEARRQSRFQKCRKYMPARKRTPGAFAVKAFAQVIEIVWPRCIYKITYKTEYNERRSGYQRDFDRYLKICKQ